MAYNTYLNWKFYKYKDANIWLLCNWLHYGVSVIEWIRAQKKGTKYKCINLQSHLNRFLSWIKCIWLETSYSKAKLRKIIMYLFDLNPGVNYPYIRLICYTWDKGIGLISEDICIWIVLLDFQVNDHYLSSYFSSFQRQNNSLKWKFSTYYLRNIVEQRKLKKWEIVIFLWEEDKVLECLSENIFFYKKWKIFTPKSHNIVNGISRNILTLIAEHLDIECIETDVTKDDLYKADEIIITWTATWFRNIVNIEGKKIWSVWLNERINNVLLEVYSWKIKINKINVDMLSRI